MSEDSGTTGFAAVDFAAVVVVDPAFVDTAVTVPATPGQPASMRTAAGAVSGLRVDPLPQQCGLVAEDPVDPGGEELVDLRRFVDGPGVHVTPTRVDLLDRRRRSTRYP